MIAEIQVIPRPAGTAADRYKHVDAAIAIIQACQWLRSGKADAFVHEVMEEIGIDMSVHTPHTMDELVANLRKALAASLAENDWMTEATKQQALAKLIGIDPATRRPNPDFVMNVPRYRGAETFAGRQLHTARYAGPAEFAGQRVVVVGGGKRFFPDGVSTDQTPDELAGELIREAALQRLRQDVEVAPLPRQPMHAHHEAWRLRNSFLDQFTDHAQPQYHIISIY